MSVYLEDARPDGTAPVTDSRKKVLLLGDSIRMGYCGTVKKQLEKIADVRYPNENCRNTQFTYVSLIAWSGLFPDLEKVDLVYWNNGHWDVAHWGGDSDSLNSPQVYCDMILRIYKKLRKIYPNAKIIFATTTPMSLKCFSGLNPRSNEEISHYNSRAVRTLSGMCETDDLNSFCADWNEEYYRDYCHFTEKGFQLLGCRVAEKIKEYM